MESDDRRDVPPRIEGFSCPRCRDGALLELQAEKIRGLSLKSEVGFAALRMRVQELEAQLRAPDLASTRPAKGKEQSRQSYVQVFYGQTSGFSEAESVRAAFPVIDQASVVLRVPPCTKATALRIDIGDAPALIEIYRLTFEPQGTALSPREFVGEELKRVCVAHGTSQAVAWRDEAFMLLSTGEDPQVLVHLPQLLKAMPHGCRLHVELRSQLLAPF